MKKLNTILVCSLVISLWTSCTEKFSGFSELDEQHFKKLMVLGNDESHSLIASYFAMQVALNPDSAELKKVSYLLVRPEELYSYIPSKLVLQDVHQMHQGEVNRYIFPGIEALKFFPDDSAALMATPFVEMEVLMEKRFDDKSNICGYFMHKAQEDMMDEVSAIKLCQSTQDITWEDHGKVSIGWNKKTNGDSISAGDEIEITYNTYWLDGTRMDSLTNMHTTFGKPGQLIPGLQYGLSFLKEGERALVYMPSELAFGESGSRTGIIPAKTPIFFDINVVEVKK